MTIQIYKKIILAIYLLKLKYVPNKIIVNVLSFTPEFFVNYTSIIYMNNSLPFGLNYSMFKLQYNVSFEEQCHANNKKISKKHFIYKLNLHFKLRTFLYNIKTQTLNSIVFLMFPDSPWINNMPYVYESAPTSPSTVTGQDTPSCSHPFCTLSQYIHACVLHSSGTCSDILQTETVYKTQISFSETILEYSLNPFKLVSILIFKSSKDFKIFKYLKTSQLWHYKLITKCKYLIQQFSKPLRSFHFCYSYFYTKLKIWIQLKLQFFGVSHTAQFVPALFFKYVYEYQTVFEYSQQYNLKLFVLTWPCVSQVSSCYIKSKTLRQYSLHRRKTRRSCLPVFTSLFKPGHVAQTICEFGYQYIIKLRIITCSFLQTSISFLISVLESSTILELGTSTEAYFNWLLIIFKPRIPNIAKSHVCKY